jgi:WD40 repeat protein
MKERITLKSHSKAVTSLAFSNDSRLLATGSYDSIIKLWDVATMSELITLQNNPIPVRAIAFSPDVTLLASAGGDRKRDSDRSYAHELSRQKKEINKSIK